MDEIDDFFLKNSLFLFIRIVGFQIRKCLPNVTFPLKLIIDISPNAKYGHLKYIFFFTLKHIVVQSS